MSAGEVSHPSVAVVIATRDREALLVKTLDAVRRQDYPGDIETIVVYDQTEARAEHESSSARRSTRVVVNDRTPGLAGARNTGILSASSTYIAFCDDDDIWLPTKLSAQIRSIRETGAIASVTGVTVVYEGHEFVRVPDTDTITVDLLARSRLTGAHPSSYLAHRTKVLSDVGLVDEKIPWGYGEDYDWLLRLAAAGRVTVVRQPLVDVLWHRGSYFTNRWQGIVDGLTYLLEMHPSIASTRAGKARVLGQIAFASAALRRRGQAVRLVGKTIWQDPREPRAYIAFLVAIGLVRPETVVHQANRRGRGI